jgi:hypothetical protein
MGNSMARVFIPVSKETLKRESGVMAKDLDGLKTNDNEDSHNKL